MIHPERVKTCEYIECLDPDQGIQSNEVGIRVCKATYHITHCIDKEIDIHIDLNMSVPLWIRLLPDSAPEISVKYQSCLRPFELPEERSVALVGDFIPVGKVLDIDHIETLFKEREFEGRENISFPFEIIIREKVDLTDLRQQGFLKIIETTKETGEHQVVISNYISAVKQEIAIRDYPYVIGNLTEETIGDIKTFAGARLEPWQIEVEYPLKVVVTIPEIRPDIQYRIDFTLHKKKPISEQLVYPNIIEAVHNLGKKIERLPSIYTGKGEEALRDLFLVYLEHHFKGSATGETFNKEGKTDILIRYENSNEFIGECLIWNGPDKFLKKFTQLLGYLSWRDTKAAVVAFVKKKDFTSILQKAREVIPTHSNFLRFIDEKDESWLNYHFHNNDDPEREIKVAVLLFHFP